MQTIITERGQISVPSELRRKYRLEAGMGVEWLETPEGIFLLPVPHDPIVAFRGKSSGLMKALREERKKEREKEKK